MDDLGTTGIVTVTYNSAEVIDAFLLSILGQKCEKFILYIVDNASTDQTPKIVARYTDARIVVISNAENGGVAQGDNLGIRAALNAQCGSVLLINNDTEFGPELLRDLRKGIRDHQCDMIAPKIMYYEEPQRIWYAGGSFDRWKGYMGVHRGVAEVDSGQFDEIGSIEYAPTCCMLIRKEVFEILGLMDERYFLYADDTDFCLRAMRSGLRLVFLPSTKLLHKVSSLTGGITSKFALRHLTRSHIYFMRKNFGFMRVACYLSGYQMRLIYKLMTRIIDVQGFLNCEAAFIEGCKVPLCTVRAFHDDGNRPGPDLSVVDRP